MPTSKIEKFGRNLGVGINPWVKRFGVSWQYHLAQAILTPYHPRYRDLRVPVSQQMAQEAEAFLTHNASLRAGFKNVWHAMAAGNKNLNTTNILHHDLVAKAYHDPLRYKAIYGNQKYIDPESRRTIQEFKDLIRQTRSYKEKRQIREKLREFEKKVSRPRWEVEAEKYAVIPQRDPSASARLHSEAKSFLKRLTKEDVKQYDMKYELREQRLWEKQFNGVDPAVAIGEGKDLSHLDSDAEALMRLVVYLKRARWIKRSVWDGIMAPKKQYVRDFLRQHLGTRRYREFFMSYKAQDKYSTNAYFSPGSEYGSMKTSYNNSRGELSPLQRRITVDKGGKVSLKDKKD